jgi:Mg2+ and Co2+ transporter CorA
MNSKQEVTNFLLQKLIATIGFILMGASLFLPWLSATSFFGINVYATGFDLSNETSNLAMFFIIICAPIIWLRNKHRQNGFICMGIAVLMGLET